VRTTRSPAPSAFCARRFSPGENLLCGISPARAMDLLFPPSCLSCRQATEAHGSLCASCWSKVRFIERPFCERLGVPFPVDLGKEGLLSPEAVANPPVYGRARAVAHFDDGPVRHLVHRLKYGDRMERSSPSLLARGWRGRGRSCFSTPISSSPCRCIKAG
jgi:predicted amidophosphoribosyltransferase